jgi:DNA-binding response OmpR family regulator
LFHINHILLADDDRDDGDLFQEILEEAQSTAQFEIIRNGEQLMQYLNDPEKHLPDILFLDLNMPRKNGFDCLVEIKHSEKLRQLPVIIFTTSYETEVINLLYKNGAHYYIRKPNNFKQLRNVIHHAVTLTEKQGSLQPPREQFVLSYQAARK